METIRVPYYLSYEFLVRNKQWHFLYGGSLDKLSHSQGQSIEAFGLSNTDYIPTKIKCCQDLSAFWIDRKIQAGNEPHYRILGEYLEHLRARLTNKIVIPFPKIGEGGSRLRQECPILYRQLMEFITSVAYPNIERII